MFKFIKIVYLISKSNRKFLDLFEPIYIDGMSISFIFNCEKYHLDSEFPKHNYFQYITYIVENKQFIRYCFNVTENKKTAYKFNSSGTIDINKLEKDFLFFCNLLVSYIKKYNKFLDK